MSTLADIHRAADTQVVTCVDDTTPAGHFTATTKMLGLTTDYLLAGSEGDPEAVIVGRIEYAPPGGGAPVAYRGGSIKGGTLARAYVTDSAAAFRAMLTKES